MVGSTSEDVDATLGEGIFGGAEETGKLLNAAAQKARVMALDWVKRVGRALLNLKPKHRDYSLLCAAYEAGIPCHGSSNHRR